MIIDSSGTVVSPKLGCMLEVERGRRGIQTISGIRDGIGTGIRKEHAGRKWRFGR